MSGNDLDRTLATGLEVDREAPRSGVERVLQQLLDHRGGTLHHLAGGDLAHQPVVEESDLRHEQESPRAIAGRRPILSPIAAEPFARPQSGGGSGPPPASSPSLRRVVFITP